MQKYTKYSSYFKIFYLKNSKKNWKYLKIVLKK